MKEYTYSDLARKSGEVLDTAAREGVSLVKHGRNMLVMIPWDHYDALRRGKGRSVFTLDETPEDFLEEMDRGLADIEADLEAEVKARRETETG